MDDRTVDEGLALGAGAIARIVILDLREATPKAKTTTTNGLSHRQTTWG